MIRDITLGQYYNTNSIIHELDPRVKLFGTMIFLVSLFVSTNVYAYLFAFIFVVIIIKLSNVPLNFIIRSVKALLPLIVMSMFFNLLFTPGETFFRFKIINITKEGFELTIKMSLRLMFLVAGSSVLTLTTTPSKLTDGIEKSLHFLKVFKVPIAEIALMMSIALRFIPILIEEVSKIMDARTARGADFDTGGIIKKAKAFIPLLVPLFISAFRRADELALAMEARCYTNSDIRTKYNPLKYRKIDIISYIFIFLYLFVIIITKFIV